MRLAFDIETNGLLHQLTKIHCIVAICIDTGKEYIYTGSAIEQGVEMLSRAELLVAHNGINFDVPAIQKLFPDFKPDRKAVLDTLVCTQLIYNDPLEEDIKLAQRGLLPKKLLGRHSLEAWGYRLGNYKGDFKPENYTNPETGEPHTWLTIPFSQEMLDYCIQDVKVTIKLLKSIQFKRTTQKALDLEHEVAWRMAEIEQYGFTLNVAGASELYAELVQEKYELEQQLISTFGSFVKRGKEVTPKKTINYRKNPLQADRTAGATYTKIEIIKFNPGSRDHIAKGLIERYGWEPQVFTDKGNITVDETVLEALPYEEAHLAAQYLRNNKLLGQLAEGDNAWLKLEREGRLHCHVNALGTVSHRASHSKPNLAQVPSLRAYKGKESRTLFTVPEGWYLMGSDASGLELRCLANRIFHWDGGAYVQEILKGDIHTANQQAAGLKTRDEAKTFIYAFLYGSGDQGIGALLAPAASPNQQKKIGAATKARFLKAIPAITALRKSVAGQRTKFKQKIKGLDGRWLHSRSEHSAVNLLLQSDGALVCKKWLCVFMELMESAGYKLGWEGDFVLSAWVHDEIQVACRTKEIAEKAGEFSQKAMRITQEFFKFNCQLDTDFNIGKNWADTH
ncbi:DNA polymerase [Microbulbifer sp. ZKSA002]|uniref:DNA polymerase n=1 Tax=Microbulbifer sp. ZKSA002 TaxID=3243388 RepID=UPI004039AD97